MYPGNVFFAAITLKKPVFLLLPMWVITLIGLGVVCYGSDHFENGDFPDISSPSPYISFSYNKPSSSIDLPVDSSQYSLISSHAFFSRSPPA